MSRKPRIKSSGVKKVSTELCFVLMPYGEPFDQYYATVFIPAVKEAGLQPLRADSLFTSGSIIGDIWRLTREAKVLLADLSNTNANVFYELGLAHAIGKPVVLVASSMDFVPFDLRGLRVLIYDQKHPAWGATLRKSISKALVQTLQDLPSAVPATFLGTTLAINTKEGPYPIPDIIREYLSRPENLKAPHDLQAGWIENTKENYSSVIELIYKSMEKNSRVVCTDYLNFKKKYLKFYWVSAEGRTILKLNHEASSKGVKIERIFLLYENQIKTYREIILRLRKLHSLAGVKTMITILPKTCNSEFALFDNHILDEVLFNFDSDRVVGRYIHWSHYKLYASSQQIRLIMDSREPEFDLEASRAENFVAIEECANELLNYMKERVRRS